MTRMSASIRDAGSTGAQPHRCAGAPVRRPARVRASLARRASAAASAGANASAIASPARTGQPVFAARQVSFCRLIVAVLYAPN